MWKLSALLSYPISQKTACARASTGRSLAVDPSFGKKNNFHSNDDANRRTQKKTKEHKDCRADREHSE